MMVSLITFLPLLLLPNIANGKRCGRILSMLSAPIDSHQIAMRPVPQELAKRGLNVVIVTPLPAFTNGSVPSNLIEIDMKYTTDNVSKRLMEYVTDNNIFDTKSQKEIFSKYTTNICNAQLKSKEVQKLIKDGKRSYDVVLFEAGGRMNTVLAHLFNVPTIRLSSLGGHFDELNTLGGVVHPLFYPEHMQQRLYNLTLWEKLNNMFNHFWFEQHEYYHTKHDDVKLSEIFGNDIPTIRDINNNHDSVMFLNVHRIWADNQPVPPSIIFYGEIDRGPHKELSQDLKNYLDTSENGVIYVSFGTTVSTTDLPTDKLQMFMNVLSEMPYNILWKSRKNQFSDIPRNIKVLEWVPQSELLKHPNIKLFITQGGIHSTHEAIAAEVPLIAVPIIGDQCYNAEKYRYHKIGDMIDFHTVSAEIFRKTIETVLSDESYRRNIANLRKLLSDQPHRPMEHVVWWIEHVIQNGARHLRAPAANMSHAEYYEVELFIILFIIALLVIALFISIIKILSGLLYFYIIRQYCHCGNFILSHVNL